MSVSPTKVAILYDEACIDKIVVEVINTKLKFVLRALLVLSACEGSKVFHLRYRFKSIVHTLIYPSRLTA